MRRVWVAVAVAALALPAFGQLSGSWKSLLCVLPTPSLGTNELALNLGWNGWTFTSTTEFSGTWGWIWQEFGVKGQLGAFGVDGTVLFGPAIPDFLYAQIIYSLDFGGIEFNAYTAMIGASLGGPVGGSVLQFVLPLGETKVTGELGFGATLPPSGFTIWHVSGSSKTYPTSPYPGGFAFTYALIEVESLPLCCGITFDLTYSFTKAGFDYLLLAMEGVGPICCGITFDLEVKFTTTAKTVSVTPKFGGFAEACFEVYADVISGGNLILGGIRVDGFKVSCTLGDCTSVTFVTFLSPERAEDYGYEEVLLPECGEFEWVELTFCGSGCCGGKYTLSLKALFGRLGGLFDLTRVVGSASIPLMANFNVLLEVKIPAAPCAGSTSLCLGWNFTF